MKILLFPLGNEFTPALVHVVWVTLMLTVLLGLWSGWRILWSGSWPIHQRLLAGNGKLRDGNESQAETMKPSLELSLRSLGRSTLGCFLPGMPARVVENCFVTNWKRFTRMKPIKWQSEEREGRVRFLSAGPSQ